MRHTQRSSFSIVVVAEGAIPAEGTSLTLPEPEVDENGFARLGGVTNHIAPEIERTDRVPDAGDDPGARAAGRLAGGLRPRVGDEDGTQRRRPRHRQVGWGRMVARRAQEIIDVPLASAVAERNVVPIELYREAEVFFG